MRIVIASDDFYPHVDGVVRRQMHTIQNLVRTGHEVLVLTSAKVGRDELWGARIMEIPGYPFAGYKDIYLGYPVIPRMLRAIRDFRPDYLHSFSPSGVGTSMWGSLCARLLRIPLVTSLHVDLDAYVDSYVAGILRPAAKAGWRWSHSAWSSGLFVTSREMRDKYSDICARVMVWPTGVDTALFRPKARDEGTRAGIITALGGGVRNLICFVGRVAAEKNIEEIARIAEGLPGVGVVLVGGGPEEEAVRRGFAEAGVPVYMAGVLDGEGLVDHIRATDAFVTASRSETLGFALMEAMACGMPVLAAAAGGHLDTITPMDNGLLYAPGDVEEGREKVRLLLERGAEMGLRARAWAVRHSWEEATEAYLSLVRESI